MRIGPRRNDKRIGTRFSTTDRGKSTLVNGNVMSKAGDTWSDSCCVSSSVKTFGARYFEVSIDRKLGGNDGVQIALVDAAQTVSSIAFPYLTAQTYIGAGYYNAQYIYGYGGHATPASGTRWWDGTDYTGPSVGVIAQGDYVSHFLDIENGKLWAGINNVWAASAVPVVNGADYHMIDRIPQTAGYKILVALYYGGAAVTLKTKRNEFRGTVPVGGLAWDE